MKTLTTAFWADPMGSMSETPEEEMAREKCFFEEELGVKLDVHMPLNVGQIKPGTDLVLFDYGGMMPGDGLAEDNSRRLLRWAEDNPNALVVVISSFTYDRAFRYAIEDSLDEAVPFTYQKKEGEQHKTPIHNVVIECWQEDFIPQWFRDAYGCKPHDVAGDIPVTKLEEPDGVEKVLNRFDTNMRDLATISNAVLLDQQLDPARRERVRKTLAGMTAAVAIVLPDQTFFNPKPAFIAYMKKYFLPSHRNHKVYDVGCGIGHITKALRKAGFKGVMPLDNNSRENSVVEITHGDGTVYPFKTHSLVLFCRPCHGRFVEDSIENAIRCECATILYVGLSKNVKNDLGRFYRKFKCVLKNIGEDKENLWVYQGK